MGLGVRSKFDAPMFESEGPSGENVLCWRQYLRNCWRPSVIQRPGHCDPSVHPCSQVAVALERARRSLWFLLKSRLIDKSTYIIETSFMVSLQSLALVGVGENNHAVVNVVVRGVGPEICDGNSE